MMITAREGLLEGQFSRQLRQITVIPFLSVFARR